MCKLEISTCYCFSHLSEANLISKLSHVVAIIYTVLLILLIIALVAHMQSPTISRGKKKKDWVNAANSIASYVNSLLCKEVGSK